MLNETKSDTTVYNVDPSQTATHSIAYQIDVLTSDSDVTDFYQERNEAWQHDNFKVFSHLQVAKENSLSPCDILPPPPPIILEGTSETASSGK